MAAAVRAIRKKKRDERMRAEDENARGSPAAGRGSPLPRKPTFLSRKMETASSAEMEYKLRFERKQRAAMLAVEQRALAKQQKKAAHRERERRWCEQYPYVLGYGYISPHFGRILPYQAEACALYNAQVVTWTVAAVIVGNFFAIIAEKELDPYPDELKTQLATWEAIDFYSNVIFIAELALNYYGAGGSRAHPSAPPALTTPTAPPFTDTPRNAPRRRVPPLLEVWLEPL